MWASSIAVFYQLYTVVCVGWAQFPLDQTMAYVLNKFFGMVSYTQRKEENVFNDTWKLKAYGDIPEKTLCM